MGRKIVSLIPKSVYSWEIVDMSGECRIIRIFEDKRNWCHSVDIFEGKTMYKEILFDLGKENEVLAYIDLVVKSMMVDEQPDWSLC